jgi:hypothetical protein
MNEVYLRPGSEDPSMFRERTTFRSCEVDQLDKRSTEGAEISAS